MIAKAEFDRIALAYNMSRNEYLQRADALKRLRNQLYVELQNAESNLGISRKEAGNTSVISDITGKVYDVLKEQGEAVRRNDVLAVIGDADKVYLKLAIDELDIEKVKTGQAVFVKLDILPGKIFEAKVSKVYPKLNREDQSFRVDAEFTGEKPSSFYGVTVEANIVISQKKNVLVVPRSVVQKGDSGWVKREGDKTRVKLQKGIENFDYVEVLGGIGEQDELFLK